MRLSSPLGEVKGIGEKTEKLYEKIGVYSVMDMLLNFPRTYEMYPDTKVPADDLAGTFVAIKGMMTARPMTKKGKRIAVTLGTIITEGENVQAVWFRMPYISSSINLGQEYIFYGRLIKDRGIFKLEQSKVFTLNQYNELKSSPQPIYNLTKGLTNNAVKKTLKSLFSEVTYLEEALPLHLIDKYAFKSYIEAVKAYHFPKDFDDLLYARKRLAYQELFYFLLQSRYGNQKLEEISPYELKETGLVDAIKKELPFELTKGQSETLDEVLKDLYSGKLSQRLIQGDVGSGKTIVAFLAMAEVLANGKKAAIMTPTEVLAIQHYETFSKYIKDFDLPFKAVLLTGSMKAAEKKEVYKILESDEAVFVIGTHALIQEKANYKDLALVVTDEQHRFGVKQREAFFDKGIKPHVIVMSATPIPRTLALILYGNMCVSAIRELPQGRLPIKSCVIGESKRNTAYNFIKKEVDSGRQAYVICPLVEAGETTEAENVSDYTDKLVEIFPDYNIACVHGKMKPAEKNAIMDDFSSGKIQILVSTTVVEVGVNVPNASIMLIENANRFGLAALHQLRGRVGRGKHQSYCIFINSVENEENKKRLDIMLSSNDGFVIAQEDLKLRGPGDFFGIRQSGDFNLKIADIIQDADELKNASADVDDLLKTDPDLTLYPNIKKELDRIKILSSSTL